MLSYVPMLQWAYHKSFNKDVQCAFKYTTPSSFDPWLFHWTSGKLTSWRGEPLCMPGLRHVTAKQRRGTWRRCAWEHSPCEWPHRDRWTDQLEREEGKTGLWLFLCESQESQTDDCVQCLLLFPQSGSNNNQTNKIVIDAMEKSGFANSNLEFLQAKTLSWKF